MANRKRKASAGRPTPGGKRPTPAPRRPAQRRPQSPSMTAEATGGDTPLRRAVADTSRGIVVWLSRQPTFLLPAVMVGLMVVGLAAPVYLGVPALVVIVAFVAWLAFLSWPVLTSGQRALRVVLIGVVVFALVGRVAGWL